MLAAEVGNYRIVAKISEGGMGAVYRAEHGLIGKNAAVKVLLPELSRDRDIVQRFFNEARATTQIKHPGIVEIYDFGFLPSGQAYLVMELLEGEPLARRIARRGRLPEAEAAGLIRSVCAALAAAHAKGIVHRDLKPDNIFLVPDAELGERPKLLDFGIAKLAEAGLAPGAKTRTGTVMGTPPYMAPEQCRGSGDIDHRADLYALGCILYELVTGRTPFVAEGAGEIIGAHQFLAPESPRVHAPGLSTTMEQIILWLLSKDPRKRPASVLELASALEPLAGPWPSASFVTPRAMTGGGPGPVAPRQSLTTLGGSAGTAVTERRRGWRLSAVVATAVVVGTGAIVAVITSVSSGPAPAALPQTAAPQTAAPPDIAKSDPPTPPAASGAAAANVVDASVTPPVAPEATPKAATTPVAAPEAVSPPASPPTSPPPPAETPGAAAGSASAEPRTQKAADAPGQTTPRKRPPPPARPVPPRRPRPATPEGGTPFERDLE